MKNKFIEGQRKASKGVTDPLPDDRLKSLEEELVQLKAEKMAGKLVDSRYAEDLVSMIKGKGSVTPLLAFLCPSINLFFNLSSNSSSVSVIVLGCSLVSSTFTSTLALVVSSNSSSSNL